MKPSHLTKRGSSLVSMGILIGLISILTITAISFLGRHVENIFSDTSHQLANGNPAPLTPPIKLPDHPVYSCNDLFNANIHTSGAYTITVNDQPLTLYCSMITDNTAYQGGWSLISIQNEPQSMLETSRWGYGIETDKDPSTFLNTSFSLSEVQIPDHEYLAYGSIQHGTEVFKNAMKLDFRNVLSAGFSNSNKIYYGISIDGSSNSSLIARTGTYVHSCGLMDFQTSGGSKGLYFMNKHFKSGFNWAYSINVALNENAGDCVSTIDEQTKPLTEGFALWVR